MYIVYAKINAEYLIYEDINNGLVNLDATKFSYKSDALKYIYAKTIEIFQRKLEKNSNITINLINLPAYIEPGEYKSDVIKKYLYKLSPKDSVMFYKMISDYFFGIAKYIHHNLCIKLNKIEISGYFNSDLFFVLNNDNNKPSMLSEEYAIEKYFLDGVYYNSYSLYMSQLRERIYNM